jgi:flagellin-specific chaperone FliS
MDDYETVKRKVEELQTRIDRASGAVSQLKSQLKKEFGVSTLKEAKALYKKMLAEEHEALTKWNKTLAKFKEDWKDVIEGDQ